MSDRETAEKEITRLCAELDAERRKAPNTERDARIAQIKTALRDQVAITGPRQITGSMGRVPRQRG